MSIWKPMSPESTRRVTRRTTTTRCSASADEWSIGTKPFRQGNAAPALAGEPGPFPHVPFFFSEFFESSHQFLGDAADADEIVERGDLASTSFSVWWLKGQRLVAAFAMSRPEEERNAAPRWI